MTKITFRIDGDPIPWKSHSGYGKKSFNPLFKQREAVQWQLKSQYNSFVLLDGPLSVSFDFYLPIPLSTSRKRRIEMIKGNIRPTKRPDTTNLVKFIEDCLKGTVIVDDSLIVSQRNDKWFCENPRILITIEKLDC